MKLTIPAAEKEALLNDLKIANLAFQQTYPGDKPDRQPVHTVYGGANLFTSDTAVKMGEIALRSLTTYAPDFVTLAKVLQLRGFEKLPATEKDIAALGNKLGSMSGAERKNEPAWLSWSVYNKIIKKYSRKQ